jgi:hypothetical protein
LIERLAEECSYIAEEIGVTGGNRIAIKLNGVEHIAGSIKDFRNSYENGISSQLAAEVG